jgi:hypothetical protein
VSEARRRKPGPWERKQISAAKGILERAGLRSAPPPPPIVAQPAPPPDSFTTIGPPPPDALAGNAWAYQLVMVAMHDVVVDNNLSPRERRKEIRGLGASATKLLPHARLWETEQFIRKYTAEIEARRARFAEESARRRTRASTAREEADLALLGRRIAENERTLAANEQRLAALLKAGG